MRRERREPSTGGCPGAAQTYLSPSTSLIVPLTFSGLHTSSSDSNRNLSGLDWAMPDFSRRTDPYIVRVSAESELVA